MKDSDRLEEMFRLQAELNRRIGQDAEGMSDDQRAHWVLQYCRALSQETAELVDSVPWKWWAKYQTFDQQNARVEVVDLFHFVISLAQVLGLSAADVYELYRKKHTVNLRRQDSGYTEKDERDNREIS